MIIVRYWGCSTIKINIVKSTTYKHRKCISVNFGQFFIVLTSNPLLVLIRKIVLRGVAQSGSALSWGLSGRGFKSRHPDQYDASPIPQSYPATHHPQGQFSYP